MINSETSIEVAGKINTQDLANCRGVFLLLKNGATPTLHPDAFLFPAGPNACSTKGLTIESKEKRKKKLILFYFLANSSQYT